MHFATNYHYEQKYRMIAVFFFLLQTRRQQYLISFFQWEWQNMVVNYISENNL